MQNRYSKNGQGFSLFHHIAKVWMTLNNIHVQSLTSKVKYWSAAAGLMHRQCKTAKPLHYYRIKICSFRKKHFSGQTRSKIIIWLQEVQITGAPEALCFGPFLCLSQPGKKCKQASFWSSCNLYFLAVGSDFSKHLNI